MIAACAGRREQHASAPNVPAGVHDRSMCHRPRIVSTGGAGHLVSSRCCAAGDAVQLPPFQCDVLPGPSAGCAAAALQSPSFEHGPKAAVFWPVASPFKKSNALMPSRGTSSCLFCSSVSFSGSVSLVIRSAALTEAGCDGSFHIAAGAGTALEEAPRRSAAADGTWGVGLGAGSAA